MRWHFIFESLAYIVAFRIYLRDRNTHGDHLNQHTRWNVIVAAVIGAALGSKLLYLLEDPAETLHRWTDFQYLWGGKTVVGAILGGTIAVELMKLHSGIRTRTGDLFAIPLCIGIAIGRIGCLLAGKQDDTFGSPTLLPWGIDLGDGVKRHPVQIYEMIAMIVLAVLLSRVRTPRFAIGDRYRLFMLAYLSWRLAVDSIKPGVHFAGLTIIQWTCAAALLWYLPDLWRIAGWTKRNEALAHG